MCLVKVLLFACAIIHVIHAICNEKDDFQFECQFWEDVEKLTQKSSIKELIVKNHTVEMICDESTFRDFQNLTIITIHPGAFTEIQADCFKGLKKLEYVQIMENQVEEIKLDSLNGSVVERLWLDGNKIEEIDVSGVFLPILRSFSLSGNRLKEFTVKTDNVPDLRILDLAYNNLTKVNVDSISLSFLKLQHNLLTELTPEMVKGKMIRMLYISENKLTEIHGKMLDNVPLVEFVHLEKNPINLIDFSNFNATSILFADNSIRLVKVNRKTPLSIDVTWDQVHRLILSNNSLNRLDMFNFTRAFVLAEAQLDGNKIREIKRDDVKQLTELIVLNLSRNRISSIEDGAFEMLKKLHNLNLADNCIHGLSDHLFSNLNSLYSMDLSKNIMTYFVVSGWLPDNQSISLTRYHVRLLIFHD